MPFRWLKTCFRCFCCYEMFDTPEELKTHHSSHTPADIHRTIDNYYEVNVLVDITDLACKLCQESIDNLHQLVHHLRDHGCIFDETVGMCLVPFDLRKCRCAVCDMQFQHHSSLVTHMGLHRNFSKMSCSVCDMRYLDSKDLCSHARQGADAPSCTDCNRQIKEESLVEHMKLVHKKRYRCPSCSQFFTSHYRRSLHVADVHKTRDLQKCVYCSRSFIFESLLKKHVKQRHLKVRDFVCDVCGYRTYEQHVLKLHMLTHAATRQYKCNSCDKMFKSKKYMRKHCLKSNH
ncbi:unnamed protein product [Leptosia nina]|uniref:C2H2-type domain-containing protein n=1 Tax=Leptosia nina TaxID=320188 RepID=A0AAV1JMQ5_9NEOP